MNHTILTLVPKKGLFCLYKKDSIKIQTAVEINYGLYGKEE